jgi:hypothetical protein
MAKTAFCAKKMAQKKQVSQKMAHPKTLAAQGFSRFWRPFCAIFKNFLIRS